MSGLKVLISGASVAGPSAAYWFAKAGAQVTVIERFPGVRPGGQSLDVRQMGVEAMQKIPGLEDSIRAKRAPFDGLAFVDKKGNTYGTVLATGDVKNQGVVSEFEILRGDLCNLLVDLTKNNPNVKYVFNEQISGLAEQEEGIRVSFKNNLPPTVYDIVVAADGVNSRNRKLGLGLTEDCIESTETCSAYFTVDRAFAAPENGLNIAKMLFAPKGRLMVFGPDTDPKKTRIVCTQATRNLSDLAAFREAVKNDTIRELTKKTFEDAGYVAKEALEAMGENDEFYATETAFVKPKKLYNGRFVLVGDAGYCTASSGIGTSLAMAGGYVLAGEVHKHKGDLKAALEAYSSKMLPMATSYQNNNYWAKRILLPETAWGIAARNSIFAGLQKTGIMEFIQRRFGGSLATAKENMLENYF